MTDDFVPERHLGMWEVEGRSDWSAVVRRNRHGLYGVTLEGGNIDYSGNFVWYPQLMLSCGATTPEQARAEAAKAVSRMVTNLLVIGAGLRRDLDEPAPAEATP